MVSIAVFTFASVMQCTVVATTQQATPSASVAIHKRFWRPEAHQATIKIGTPVSLSAGTTHAKMSQTMINSWELFFEWLNKEHQGILVNGVHHAVELVLQDDMSLPGVAAWATDHLIQREGVEHFLGPYSSTLTGAMSPIVQAAGKVQVAPGSSVTSVFQPHDQIFGTLPPTSKWLAGAMEVVGAAALGVRKSLMYLVEDTSFTESACHEVPGLAALHNFDIVADQINVSVTATGTPMPDIVDALEQHQPDVVVACVYTDVCRRLLAHMTERRYSPKALILTLCDVEESFLHKEGLAGLFALGISPWLPDPELLGPVTGDWTAHQFAVEYARLFSEHSPYQAASSFAAAAALVFAIETAGTLNPVAAAAVLRNMSEDSMWGRLAFDSNGQCSNQFRVVQSYVDSPKTVFPPASATAGLVYPKPDWLAMQCIRRRGAGIQVGFGFINDTTCQQCPRGWTSLPWDHNGTQISICAQCPPGHAGVKSGNNTACVQCPVGLFSNKSASTRCHLCSPGFFNNVSGNTGCAACPVGTFTETAASSQCNQCDDGYFQDFEGQTSCKRCSIGTFSDERESTACKDCPPSFSTQGTGFSQASDCGCPEGTFNRSSFDVSMSPRCEPCPRGVDCPGFVEPQLLPGFYEEMGKFNPSHGVWECKPAASCPGGPPGTCVDRLTDKVCSQCPIGRTWSQANSNAEPVCRECSAGNTTVSILLPFILMASMAAVYYVANSPIAMVTTTNLAASIMLGICLAVVQVVGMLGQLLIPWPESINDLVNLSKVSVSDGNALGVACSVGKEPLGHYLTLFLIPWASVATLLLMFLLSKTLPLLTNGHMKVWSWRKVFNTLCQLGQTVFITLTVLAASPLQCYSHPNGLSTIVSYPSVVCWNGESGHGLFLLMSVTLLSFFVLPFCCLAAWGSYTTYASSQQRGIEAPQLTMYRFLIYRFRPSVWWWGNAWNLRQLLLGLTPLVTPDDTGNQLTYMLIVLLFYLVATTAWVPWRTVEINILDICSSIFLMSLGIIMMTFAPLSADDHRRVQLLVAMFALTICCLIVAGVYGLVQFFCHGNGGIFGYQYPQEKELDKFADFLQAVARALASLDRPSAEKMVREMTTLDRVLLEKVFDAMLLTTNLIRYNVHLPARRTSFVKTLRLVTPMSDQASQEQPEKFRSQLRETAQVEEPASFQPCEDSTSLDSDSAVELATSADAGTQRPADASRQDLS